MISRHLAARAGAVARAVRTTPLQSSRIVQRRWLSQEDIEDPNMVSQAVLVMLQ